MSAWSAPGKLFLLGEYGVLEGGRALVCAVDRRATARLDRAAAAPSPVIEAVLAELARRGRASPEGAITVDTGAFRDAAGAKLGLGSSAVAAVLAAAVARDEGDEETLEVAIAAHRAAAGGEGSAVDVAACFFGGVIAAKRQPSPVTPLPSRLPGLHLAVLSTGVPAATPELIARARAVDRWRDHAALFSRLSDEGIDAWARQDASRFLSVVARFGRAMEVLGREAGVTIVDARVAEVMRLAGEQGAAAKPSGAGGGDVVVLFARDPALGGVIAERTGMALLPLGVDAAGLRRERASER